MIIAIDTGGTKTLVTSFDVNGNIGPQIKFETPHDTTEYIRQLRSVISDNFDSSQIEAVIAAIPGVIEKGVVQWCGNLPWKMFDAKSALSGVVGKVPIFIENDAKLAGLGETRMLETIPSQALYIAIKTGIGSGIISEGHIDQALRNSEAGHALIEFEGELREWESFASGKAIHSTFGRFARDITDEQTWDQIADRISRGFLVLIPTLQPDIIIIGGSIGTYFNKYSGQLQRILKEKLPPMIPCPPFVQAKYPEQAVIYGCYYYALDKDITITT